MEQKILLQVESGSEAIRAVVTGYGRSIGEGVLAELVPYRPENPAFEKIPMRMGIQPGL